MLLSVAEAADILEMKVSHLYYLLEFSRIDGAIKLFSTWRIDEESLRGLYERINEKRAGILPGYNEFIGFDEQLENIRKTSLSSDKKSANPRIQGRKGMECPKKRPDSLDRGTGGQIIQLSLWPDDNFWP